MPDMLQVLGNSAMNKIYGVSALSLNVEAADLRNEVIHNAYEFAKSFGTLNEAYPE